jgi:hypothetical protein
MGNAKAMRRFGWLLLTPLALLGWVDEIRSEQSAPLTPGQKVGLSVPIFGARPTRYSWRATTGHFDGPTDRAHVIFVAPTAESATITCSEEVGGETRLHNRTILIAQTASRPQAPPEPSNSGPAANGAPVYDIGRGGFAPSGWMGDGEKKNGFSTEISDETPNANAPSSRKWVYRPQGAGWGGVAYQFPAGNWGDKEGRNLSGKGYRELSVWARGVPDKNGRFPVVQFKAGGGSDPAKKYQASFEAEGDFVTLTGEWARYTVSLASKNLSSVISAFTFVLRSEDNPSGATFVLSEIEYR